MKKSYLTLFLTVLAIFLFTKSGLTQTNKKELTVNFGLSDEGYGYPNNLQDVASNVCPTINLYSEYFLDNLFSIGIYGAYTYSYFKFHDYTYPADSYKDAWKGWDFGLRYTFHFSQIFTRNKKTDLYLSAFSGYTTRALVYDKKNIYRDDLNYDTDAFGVGGILGARYFISNRIGVYGEAGFSRKLFLGGGVIYQLFNKRN